MDANLCKCPMPRGSTEGEGEKKEQSKRSVQLQFTEVSFQAHDVAAAAAAADELAAANNMEQLEMDAAVGAPEPQEHGATLPTRPQV